jgi:recombination protein RecR
MYKTPFALEQTIQALKKLPGVGHRTAMRYALHLLELDSSELKTIVEDIGSLKSLERCSECNLFLDRQNESKCSICNSYGKRDEATLCVVETFNDFLAIENSGKYHGLFHLLGGVLNPLIGIGPDQLFLKGLKVRLQERDITEVILALNPSLEGEATCSFIKEFLGDEVSVKRIGFGVPMGGSLEFLNAQTISTALSNLTKIL